MIRKISPLLSGGLIGAFVSSAVAWAFGEWGVTRALGARIHPAFTAAWLYPRLVWGALWALLFLVPVFKGSVWKRGLLVSLGPTLAQLFYFLPRAGYGTLGTDLGATAPLLVLFFNAVWGWVAAAWIEGAR